MKMTKLVCLLLQEMYQPFVGHCPSPNILSVSYIGKENNK